MCAFLDVVDKSRTVITTLTGCCVECQIDVRIRGLSAVVAAASHAAWRGRQEKKRHKMARLQQQMEPLSQGLLSG